MAAASDTGVLQFESEAERKLWRELLWQQLLLGRPAYECICSADLIVTQLRLREAKSLAETKP